MHFHNDPTDNIDDFLPNWDALSSDIDDATFVSQLENQRRDEYAALADL